MHPSDRHGGAIQKPRGQTDAIAFSLACVMAFLAGATDVCGLSQLHDLFVSFMSGNTTMLAFALGHGDFARARFIAGLIGLFAGGAFLGTIVAVVARGYHSAVVVLLVAVMLLAAILWPAVSVSALVLAMGALNAAMNRAGATGVSLTYVTGTLVKFAQGLGHAVCGQDADPSWPLQGVLWLALFLGAAAGTIALHWFADYTLLSLCLLALAVAGVAALRPDRVPDRIQTVAS